LGQRASDAQVARLGYDAGEVLTPGDDEAPPLPWDLRVVRQGDGQILLSKHVTELPGWVTVIESEAAFTTIPVAGPPGPSCDPGL